MTRKAPLRLSRPEADKGALKLDGPDFEAFVNGGRTSADTAESKPRARGQTARRAEAPPPEPVVPSAPPPQTVHRAAIELVEERPPADTRSDQADDPPILPRVREALIKVPPIGDEARLPAAYDDLFDETFIPDDTRSIGLRIPEIVARKLDRIADAWLCHRHQIMLDLLTPRLRELAKIVDRGKPPRVPAIGHVRSGRKRAVTVRLRDDAADDLDRVTARYGSIKSLLLTRLLVPAVNALYEQEFGADPNA